MISWQLKSFTELTNDELYAIMRLRQEVFVVEQNCVFIDADDLDQPSLHLMGFINAELAAYARIIPAGMAYDEVSIGRIVTSQKYRKQNHGRTLMQKSLDEAARVWGASPVKIMAQEYLQRFYEDYGFVKQSEHFLLDGIWHIYMVRA